MRSLVNETSPLEPGDQPVDLVARGQRFVAVSIGDRHGDTALWLLSWG